VSNASSGVNIVQIPALCLPWYIPCLGVLDILVLVQFQLHLWLWDQC